MKNNQRILVTGGSGFIGHRLVKLLTNNGQTVLNIDNLSSKMPMVNGVTGLVNVLSDIRDEETVERCILDFKPDCVVHLAAVHHIPTCELKRAYALDVNVRGTEIILSACEKARTKRFVLASTGAVYDTVSGPLDERSTPLRYTDNYSLAKSCNESQVSFWSKRTDSSARIARIFNTIGHDDPNGHLIPDVLAQIGLESNYAKIRLGNIETLRDYIYADDTANGLFKIVENWGGQNCLDTYNLCTGSEWSVYELVMMIGRLIGKDIEIEIDELRRRKVDRPSQLGSPHKTLSEIGFKASCSLEGALAKILDNKGYNVPKHLC